MHIRLSEDRRIFTAVARSSYGWQDLYDTPTAVERVNSRLAGWAPFGMDHRFIRGLVKMFLRCTVALCAMLSMALGRIQTDQRPHLRRLLHSAYYRRSGHRSTAFA